MPTDPGERRRHHERSRRKESRESGQATAELQASHPRPAVTSAKSSEGEISRLKEIIIALQQKQEHEKERRGGQRGEEERRGRESQEEMSREEERGSQRLGREEERDGSRGVEGERGRRSGRESDGEREVRLEKRGRRSRMEGEERGRGDLEEADGRERPEELRWRLHQLERDKLELTSLHNQEMSSLQSQLARLRSDVERGEAHRQTLEYQLAVSRREADRVTTLTKHNHKLTVRSAELQQRVSDLQKALDMTRQAREEDQHALQQEVEERDRLVLCSTTENDRLTAENDRLHHLLQDQEEGLEGLKKRMAEVGKERERDAEAIRQQASELKYLTEKEERAMKELESSEQKVKMLESNIEAERAAHLQSKFNSEIIQLRIRDLESAVSVEKTGHQEALSNLQLIRDQFGEVERAYTLEREKNTRAVDSLDKLQKDYQQCKSDLTVALETERKTTSDLAEKLQEEKILHVNTHTLLGQAKERQSCIEETYLSFTKQIINTLYQYSNTGSMHTAEEKDNLSHSAEVLQLLTNTLSHYHLTLNTVTTEVQDLRSERERLEEENQTHRQLTSDQLKQIQESQLLLSSTTQEVMRLQQEGSDLSMQANSLRAELETTWLTLERERRSREEERERGRRESEEREREKEEEKAGFQRIAESYQRESKEHLSFLSSLYQRLLAGCVLLDDSQNIMDSFSWAELCDVITEQINQLKADLSRANERIAHLEGVCESKSVCVRELQRSQECVLSKLEESVRQREQAWNTHRQDVELQHTHTVTQLHNKAEVYRSQRESLQDQLSSLERDRSSLTSDLSKLRSLLARTRRDAASLLSAAALLAGALTHTYHRAHTLSTQKSLLCRWLAERESVEGEVRRLVNALGEEEEERGGGGEERGRGLRRWRRCVCVVLAVNRMCVLARGSSVLFRVERAGGERRQAVCVSVYGSTAREKGHTPPTTDKEDDDGEPDEGRGGECVRWLRSKQLSSLLLSSMVELQGALEHTGSSPSEVMSAARSGVSRLLEHLLNQSDSLAPMSTLVSRLGEGLSRLKAPQPSTKALVSTLQQHFLLFSQRLHSAEVERRGLRMEVANLKRVAKAKRGRNHEDPCHLVPAERFDSVCAELRLALSREQEAQALLKEQSTQLHNLGLRLNTQTAEETDRQHTLSQAVQSLSEARQEVRRKEQSLRILGKHLSGIQREKRDLEENLHHTEEVLRTATRSRDSLVSYMKAAESSYREVRDSLVQSRCSVSGQPLPLQLPRMHLELTGAERMLGGAEVAACQSLVSTFSELYQAASSRIGWLEQEISAHRSHVTALRSELQDACLRDNLTYVPVAEYPQTPPLVDPDAPPPDPLRDSFRDPAVSPSPALSQPNHALVSSHGLLSCSFTSPPLSFLPPSPPLPSPLPPSHPPRGKGKDKKSMKKNQTGQTKTVARR